MPLRFAPARGASVLISSSSRGPTGAAATVTIGTTTGLAAGATPTVSNSGSTSAAVLNFGVPKGADSGFRYLFESSTSMGAPASGGIRLNNATLSAVTAIAVNASNADGVDISDFVATWDDSSNPVKGAIGIRKEGSGTVLGILTITSVVDNSTWLQINVTYVSGSGSLSAADPVYIVPYIRGDVGDVISNTSSSVDNEIVLFSGTLGKTLKRATTSGVLKGTSGVISAASAGTDYCAATSGSSVLKGSSGNTAVATAGTDYMHPGTTSALTKGFTSASVDAGTKSSGTYTFDPTAGGVQHVTNGGAHTFAPPATMGAWQLDYVNNGSAGALTTSGWTKVDGDAFDTTNTHAFRCMLSVGNSGSYLSVKRMV